MNKQIPTTLGILIIVLLAGGVVGATLFLYDVEEEIVDIEDEADEWDTYRNEEYRFEIKYPSAILGEKVLIKDNKIIVGKGFIENSFIPDSPINFAEITFPEKSEAKEADEWIDLKQKEKAMTPFEECYKIIIADFSVAICEQIVAVAVPIYYENREYFVLTEKGGFSLNTLVLKNYSTDPLDEEKTKVDISKEEIEEFYRVTEKMISSFKFLD